MGSDSLLGRTVIHAAGTWRWWSTRVWKERDQSPDLHPHTLPRALPRWSFFFSSLRVSPKADHLCFDVLVMVTKMSNIHLQVSGFNAEIKSIRNSILGRRFVLKAESSQNYRGQLYADQIYLVGGEVSRSSREESSVCSFQKTRWFASCLSASGSLKYTVTVWEVRVTSERFFSCQLFLSFLKRNSGPQCSYSSLKELSFTEGLLNFILKLDH